MHDTIELLVLLHYVPTNIWAEYDDQDTLFVVLIDALASLAAGHTTVCLDVRQRFQKLHAHSYYMNK